LPPVSFQSPWSKHFRLRSDEQPLTVPTFNAGVMLDVTLIVD